MHFDGLNWESIEKQIKSFGKKPPFDYVVIDDFFTKDFAKKLSDPTIKDELKDRTDAAFKKGIFGAPTFIVNGKMFWGQDRLEFVFRESKK